MIFALRGFQQFRYQCDLACVFVLFNILIYPLSDVCQSEQPIVTEVVASGNDLEIRNLWFKTLNEDSGLQNNDKSQLKEMFGGIIGRVGESTSTIAEIEDFSANLAELRRNHRFIENLGLFDRNLLGENRYHYALCRRLAAMCVAAYFRNSYPDEVRELAKSWKDGISFGIERRHNWDEVIEDERLVGLMSRKLFLQSVDEVDLRLKLVQVAEIERHVFNVSVKCYPKSWQSQESNEWFIARRDAKPNFPFDPIANRLLVRDLQFLICTDEGDQRGDAGLPRGIVKYVENSTFLGKWSDLFEWNDCVASAKAALLPVNDDETTRLLRRAVSSHELDRLHREFGIELLTWIASERNVWSAWPLEFRESKNVTDLLIRKDK